MRQALLRTAFVVLLLAVTPSQVGAEGVLRQPQGPRTLYRPQHPCVPGQNATDPDCREARRLDCLGTCRHDFTYNGDMMYLRWCERGCGEKGER